MSAPKVIELAIAGDTVALRLCMERIAVHGGDAASAHKKTPAHGFPVRRLLLMAGGAQIPPPGLS